MDSVAASRKRHYELALSVTGEPKAVHKVESCGWKCESAVRKATLADQVWKAVNDVGVSRKTRAQAYFVQRRWDDTT